MKVELEVTPTGDRVAAAAEPVGLARYSARLATAAAFLLPLFVLIEVNRPTLRPQSQLALFALFGLLITFLQPRLQPRAAAGGSAAGRSEDGGRSLRSRWPLRIGPVRRHFGHRFRLGGDLLLAVASLVVCLYVVVQTEPLFSPWWHGGRSLGDRAGLESAVDIAIGALGLVVIMAAARKSLGWALPGLATVFLIYAWAGPYLPDLLMPHRGYGLSRIVGQTFLHGQGVFGIALKVMFSYVFLFVLFGALLEATGATGYVIDASKRLFGRGRGGPAKVSVLSSGLMGSLSGSAVANTATTGTFTIPMMRSVGFRAEDAAGIEAAASSGGALVPPVMGAGAYMMLEIVEPAVTYVEILQAALLPAILYYFSLFMIVHFRAGRVGSVGSLESTAVIQAGSADESADSGGLLRWQGAIFAGALAVLIVLLINGFTVFRAVSVAIAAVIVLAAMRPETRIGPRRIARTMVKASRGGVALVAAAASVGIILGIVILTGVGTRLPSLILPLAENNLFAALVVIMISSLVLGMGLPSAVCYLLLATLIGPVLSHLGVVPLAAHLFIFYFGMMSMVTPPVALAAYAASSIAGSKLLPTTMAAFRFALVGFTLPFLFVYRPQLLMLAADGSRASFVSIALAVAVAACGIVPLAAALGGCLRRPLTMSLRLVLVGCSMATLFPGTGPWLGAWGLSILNLVGIAGLGTVWMIQGRSRGPSSPALP